MITTRCKCNATSRAHGDDGVDVPDVSGSRAGEFGTGSKIDPEGEVREEEVVYRLTDYYTPVHPYFHTMACRNAICLEQRKKREPQNAEAENEVTPFDIVRGSNCSMQHSRRRVHRD